MKAGSNAGGILLLGVGILMLNLAYTNRGKAVWAAITGQPTAVAEVKK